MNSSNLVTNTTDKHYSYPVPPFPLISQKANSIWWIEQNLPFNALPAIYLKPGQEITEDILESIPFPAFIRPCPVNPRPGVIESDIVHQKESFLLIFKFLSRKMLEKHEGMGDIVIQPFKAAIANIVWTAGIMVIGPDHDGATKGIYPTIIMNALPPDFYKKAIGDLFIPAADIEMIVERDMTVWVTQIRSTHSRPFSIAPGPKGAFSALLSHSPLKVADNRIITIDNMEEGINALCDQMKRKEENVIVYHPDGSPLSHIASLCLQRNYSYVTADVRNAGWLSEPTRGWVIKGRSLDDDYPIEYFPGDFFRGIEAGVKPIFPSDARKIWKTILPFHHYVHQISLCQKIAYLSGIFVGNLLRVILAIAVRKVWQLTKQIDVCPGIKDKLALCDTTKGFNTYMMLSTVALQIPYEQFTPCLHTLYNYFKAIDKEELKEYLVINHREWQGILELGQLIQHKIEERNRDEVLRLSLMVLEILRQIPWALLRLLERDDVYAMQHLSIPQTWSRTAQAWAQSLLILEDNDLRSATNRLPCEEKKIAV
jgi:hypothetical protein